MPFIGVVEKDCRLWLVSKFMYGGNVEYTGRENCDLRHLAERAAKGLSYLHALDPPIVHGDIKGFNVLADKISRSDDNWTLPTSAAETFNWIAPELIFLEIRRPYA
ncbi:hypothetical protein DEU56DRAFT_905758 [Suillus clintonianus]|uniref:uncharacterized protein n=1 Tax=Suillus clintonianus TaxID=1904413 RepID=UPI001B8811BC|nr:uncharacterized protein DEU56DRAFT_905758 [Suillus clintonianus]KAG2157086.1 hypothetical protein DEU56DRAFT_905758 [Suillus clintonianus]